MNKSWQEVRVVCLKRHIYSFTRNTWLWHKAACCSCAGALIAETAVLQTPAPQLIHQERPDLKSVQHCTYSEQHMHWWERSDESIDTQTKPLPFTESALCVLIETVLSSLPCILIYGHELFMGHLSLLQPATLSLSPPLLPQPDMGKLY